MSSNKQVVVKIVVNSPTAAPVAEGNVAKAKEYMEQSQALLEQMKSIQQQTQDLADNAADSAADAAESASSAFAAQAPLWEDGKTYNPPEVVAGSDGNTYRCIVTNTNVNPVDDDGTNWKRITYNTSGIITLDNDENVTPYSDTTGNIVPNALGGDLGTSGNRWNNVFATKIYSQSMEINGQDIENLASGGRTTLQRNTTYTLGEVVYSGYFPNWMYIECSQAGVTGDVRPDSLFPTTEIGSEITDGTAKWITRHVHDGHVKGEVFPMSGASFTSDGYLIHPILGITMYDTHICNGSEGTPDLQGRFILGNSDSYTEGSSGGEITHTLTTSEMPVHNHGASSNNTGAHTHDIRSREYGGSRNITARIFAGNGRGDTDWSYEEYSLFDNSTYSGDNSANVWMVSAGGHSHSITINSTGSGQAHNNMPPYYTLVYVMKIR